MAVAFSGGLDSGLIATLTAEYASDLTLYTAGIIKRSDGIETMSPDATVAERVAREMGLRWEHIEIDADGLVEDIERMMRITGTNDPIVISFELPLFHVCANCSEDMIIGGQGADEMFKGYSKYVGLEPEALETVYAEDMKRLNQITIPHERKVAEYFGKRISYPYLDEEMMSFIQSLDHKLLMPSNGSRKELLREVARKHSPAVASREKKAAQYGSGVMDALRRSCKDKGITYGELIESIQKKIASEGE